MNGTFKISGLHIDFSASQKIGLSNGFLTSTAIEEMLEWKECYAVDAIISFRAAIFDRSLRRLDMPVLSPTHFILKIVNFSLFGAFALIAYDQLVLSLQVMIDDWKRKANELFWDPKDINLFNQKFYFLDNVFEDVV